MIVGTPLDPLKVMMENGRMITGPHGSWSREPSTRSNIYRDYVGVDACMSNLMRPGMYGAYHHITCWAKRMHPTTASSTWLDHSAKTTTSSPSIARCQPSNAVTSLSSTTPCSWSRDGIPVQRQTPLCRAAREARRFVKMIRRAETHDDYFATLDFSGLKPVAKR